MKSEAQKRKHRFTVNFTEAEYKDFKTQAKKSGLSLQGYSRAVLLSGEPSLMFKRLRMENEILRTELKIAKVEKENQSLEMKSRNLDLESKLSEDTNAHARTRMKLEKTRAELDETESELRGLRHRLHRERRERESKKSEKEVAERFDQILIEFAHKFAEKNRSKRSD